MAEALATASAIAGLLSLSGTILSQGYGFISSVTGAPKHLRFVLSETAALNTVLDQLQTLATDSTSYGTNSTMRDLQKSGSLDDCQELLRPVQRSIAKCEQIKGQELRNLGKALVWPFEERETRETVEKLSRIRGTFSTALSVDMRLALDILALCPLQRHH